MENNIEEMPDLFDTFHKELFGHPIMLDDSINSVHIWSKEIAKKTKAKYTPKKITQEEYDLRIMQELNKIIPEQYPETLELCLKIIENVRYEAFGFPMFFLTYDYSKLTPTQKKWDCAFRNPVSFENPNIACDTPLEAVHKMFVFLRTRKLQMRIK